MNTQIATTKSFQERMFERVRDQMGELITNEELKVIVEHAVKEAFFKERVDNSGYNKVTKPPYFVELLQTHLKEQVRETVLVWFKENPEVVTSILDDIVKEGIAKAVMQAIDSRMSAPLYTFVEQLKAKGIFL